MSDRPVVVVGAGPVGMAAALFLARHGVASVVLEAAARRETVGSRSICVQRDVLDLLERIGVGARLARAGVTWTTGRIFYREHEVVTMRLPASEPGAFPPFVNIGQTEVERELEARVRAEPLVDLRYGQRVVCLEQDGSGVRVETPGGVVAGSHCVAADGHRSAVRGLLGLEFAGRSFGDRFLISDIRADLGFDVPERRFYFDPPWNPGRQVLLHPQPDSVWRIDWQVADDVTLDLDAMVRRIVPGPYEAVWSSVYRFHQRLAERFVVGRTLLAGDAAHVMSPFGARGMNSGLFDAENAAWKIALDRCGRGGPGLLESYDAERRAAAVENLRVTGRTMRFLVPATDEEHAHRRSVLERAVRDESVRDRIDSGRLSEPFWYVDSPLTTVAGPLDDFPREAGAVRPPVPGVLCPDAALPDGTRLRSRFGPSFTLLTASESAVPGMSVLRPPGTLAAALGIGAEGAALVRPDGYLAAVFPSAPSPAALTAAARRASGYVPST
ncbi:FAD-dependent monooxygenase [Amycolatopsis suaedae]|uniref:FAD-dependent monooxygenase n=1 Tax=Amycolatopsis suaedae TaxID=2510978 RepID=UPI001F10C350|nr:FAD-dependent monooxygenase [Amycolatopsis suaedae]